MVGILKTAGSYNGLVPDKWWIQFISAFVSQLSAEFILNRLPNGGTVILLRSLWTGGLLNLFALMLLNLLDPRLSWQPSFKQFETQIVSTLPWTGAILGAVYASLYARFASQWSYLAGVYNQIKAAECASSCNGRALAEWKAGFMEDAEDLHLARKPVFASIIHAWAKQSEVMECYLKHVPGGERRFEVLVASVLEITARTARKYQQADKRFAAVAN